MSADPCPLTPRLRQCRDGTSGLPRAQELALLEAFRAWRAAEPPAPPRPADAPCVYRGAVLRTDACASCRGTVRVRVKVYACAHPAAGPETTLRRCQGCAYFDPRPPLPPPAPSR